MKKIKKRKGSALIYSMALLSFAVNMLIISYSLYLESTKRCQTQTYIDDCKNPVIRNQIIIDKVNSYINKNNENKQIFNSLSESNKKMKFNNIVLQYEGKGCYSIRTFSEAEGVINISYIYSEIKDNNVIILYNKALYELHNT